MVENSTDSGNTSFLSLSYDQGIKRITGKLDETQDEFALADEIVKARKAGWEELFDKFAKATDTTELNYLTLRPVDDSDESEVPVRIPVRKSSAQIQYWIDTGNAPCRLLQELKGSDDESISISESEAEEPEEFKSSTSRSMVVALKPMDTSHERRVESGSSFSSVDTAAYIRSSANSKRGEKRPRTTEPGKLDNSKVARCINAAWPKVLVTRLPDPNNEKEDVHISPKNDSEVKEDVENEVSRESLAKKRKLYVGEEDLCDITAEDVLPESPKIRFERKSLHPAMDSPSTFPQRKTMNFGPRLLTATWRQSRNNSITKRLTKKRSTLFKPRTPIPTRSSLRRAVKGAQKSGKKIEARNEKTDPESSTEEKKEPSASAKPQDSPSIGSADVSQMIKEDLKRDAEISQLSTVARIKRINEDGQNSGEGSIFRVGNDFCEETLEKRKQNIKHAKKNLYKTLLEASIDSESPLASQSERNKPAQLRLILHDFLDLKDCCGKTERENNEYWLRRKERNAIESKEEKDRSSRKKELRSERKPKSSKRSKKSIYMTKFDFATDSSNASEKAQSLVNVERNETKVDKRRGNVTFTNTKRNQSSFMIEISSSSEDEDIFQVLNSISKAGSMSKNRSYEENEKNTSTKTTNILRIVSSSSEDGEKPVEKLEETKRAERRSKRINHSKISTESKSSEDLKGQTKRKKRMNSPGSSVDFFDGPNASKSAKAVHTSTIGSSSLEEKKKTVEKDVKTQKSTMENVAQSRDRNSTKSSSGSESSEIFQTTRKKPSIAPQSSVEKRKRKIGSSSFKEEKKIVEKVDETAKCLGEDFSRNKDRNFTSTASGSESSVIFQRTRKKPSITPQSSVEKRKKTTLGSSGFEEEKKTGEKVDETAKSLGEDFSRNKDRNFTSTASGSESSVIFQRTRKKPSITPQSSAEKRKKTTLGSSGFGEEKKTGEKVDETAKSLGEDFRRSEDRNFTRTASGSESSEIFQPARKKPAIASRSLLEKRNPVTFRELRGKYLKQKNGKNDVTQSKSSEKMKYHEKLNGKSKNTETLITGDERESEKTVDDELEDNNEKENETAEIYSNVKKSLGSNAKRIEDLIKYDDDGSKDSAKIVESVKKATRTRLSTVVRDLSDDSSVADDTIIFSQKNYAGSNSTEDKTNGTIDSRILTQLKKRSRNNRVTSTVVYRTKESWETDSDHF